MIKEWVALQTSKLNNSTFKAPCPRWYLFKWVIGVLIVIRVKSTAHALDVQIDASLP